MAGLDVNQLEALNTARFLEELYHALVAARVGDGTYQQTTELTRLMILLAPMFDKRVARN